MKRFFHRLLERLRGLPANVRVERTTSRAILGSLSLGDQKREPLHLWRAILWPILALLAYQVQAGALAHFGPEVVRIEVGVLVVTFLALHLGTFEGALAAYGVGHVADLFIQGPPGLCRFVAVLVWVVVRVVSARVHAPGWLAAPGATLAAAVGWQAALLAGIGLVAGEGKGPGTIAWLSVVPQAILTAAVALPVHALLARFERIGARGEATR